MTNAPLHIGVQVFPGAPTALVEEAGAYEQLGFASVWVADHYHGAGRDRSWPVPELFSLLGAVATATESVTLGAGVAAMLRRNPADVAHAALTLNALTGGRFRLGLGTGFGPDLAPFGVATQHPAGRLAEAIAIIRGLGQSGPDRPFSYQGRWATLNDAFLSVPGSGSPPLFVAAMGQRTLALTQAHADGWLPFGLTPELYAVLRQRVEPADRPFEMSLWLPMFIEAPGEDRSAEAEATGRLYLSMSPLALKLALGEDSAHDSPLAWSPTTLAAISDRIPATLAREAVLHGPPDACRIQLQRFRDAGLQSVVLRVTDATRRPSDLTRFAHEVLPAFTSGT